MSSNYFIQYKIYFIEMWYEHKTGKFHAHSLSLYQVIHNNAFLTIHNNKNSLSQSRLNPLSVFKKRQNIDNFFYFWKYFVILSRMIFVGTLPIYVIFLDMLHCLAKKICLYPKHFSLVIQTLQPFISILFLTEI